MKNSIQNHVKNRKGCGTCFGLDGPVLRFHYLGFACSSIEVGSEQRLWPPTKPPVVGVSHHFFKSDLCAIVFQFGDFPTHSLPLYPPTTDGVLDTKNAPYPFTCYPSPNPSPEDASLNLFIVQACATQFVKNIGVFDSPRVRFRILSSSSGTSPASPASSASAPAKDADDASDAGDVAEEKGGDLGGKRP